MNHTEKIKILCTSIYKFYSEEVDGLKKQKREPFMFYIAEIENDTVILPNNNKIPLKAIEDLQKAKGISLQRAIEDYVKKVPELRNACIRYRVGYTHRRNASSWLKRTPDYVMEQRFIKKILKKKKDITNLTAYEKMLAEDDKFMVRSLA